MKVPFLIGEKIYLRGLRSSDVDGPYVNWLNDTEVCQYNSHHVFPYSHTSALEYIQAMDGNRHNLVLAVCLKGEDRHIGNISLQNINYLSRNAEFAILMGDKNEWGKGNAKEAAFLICNHSFNSLNLHRIYCGTSAENKAMQQLAVYMGMREEGRRREAQFKDGHYVDIIEYGVLREEFLAKFHLEKSYQGTSL